MKFWWWDDAIAHADSLARATLIRHKVTRGVDGHWTVDLADNAVAVEPCS